MNENKVCIIGAGSSGITAAKALFEANIPFDCFEKGSHIGGNWLYNNDNGMSSAYQSLHINTSKQLMAYSDFPMPSDYPDYPNHELVYNYFENYIDKFGFREKISFNTSVLKVEKLSDNKYLVTTDKFPPKEYTAIVVANGHHWLPKWAKFEGEFTGTVSHSHHYKTYNGFEGKRVLVVGIGNSAVDIACELTTVATSVTVSTRSGAYIMPKYLFGKPTDHLTKPPMAYAPIFLKRLILKLILKLNIGNQANYGVPVPNRKILKEHPTISQEFLNKTGHGKIKIKPNIKKLNGNEVIFTDGTKQVFDHIIYSTGYQINFPFFNEKFFTAVNNEMPLYQYVADISNPGLFFIGFIQPLGAVMPLAELQAVWVAKIIKGLVRLPAKQKMERWIIDNRNKMKARYGMASRHTMEVDFYPYKNQLKKLAGFR